MEITSSTLSVLFTQADLRFQSVLNATPVWSSGLASTIASGTGQNIYAWMDRIPAARQWVGQRVLNSMATHQRAVVNVPWELTDYLLEEDVINDQFGIFNFNLTFMAQQMAKLPDQQIANYLLNNAASTASAPINGFDGVPLFSTAHPILGGGVAGGTPPGASSTQSNLFVNTALSFDNYAAVRTAMMALLGADGKPLGIVPNLLVYPPQLEKTAKLILEADFLPNTGGTAPQSNIYQNSAKGLMIPELASAPNRWYLFDTTKPVMPMIWQTRTSPEFTYMIQPTDFNVFMTRQFVYGAKQFAQVAESVWYVSAAATSDSSY